MAKYLVTGGAGFIGSNIAESLVKSGQSVRVVDDLSTGSLGNMKSFIDKIEFIRADLSDYEAARRAVEGAEYILHQAAIPSVPRSVEDPVACNRSIVSATVNLFKAAVDGKTVKRIVQAASSSAYGDTPALPKQEDMAPNPLSPYAVAKLAQEYYAGAFYNVYGLEVISLRYFNVFGPRQDPESFYSAVIPRFISLMLKGKRPTIFGDGLTSRDFTHVDNVVEANLLACGCKWPGKAEVINIGCGQSITLNELAEKINLALGTGIKPVYAPERVGDVKHSLADIGKAKDLLGYTVKVGFDEGLKKLVDWYRNG